MNMNVRNASVNIETGVCARVWEICEENPLASSREIAELAIQEGIHPVTAVTQYFRWKKALSAKVEKI